jgi:hypothetical protein
MAKLMNANSDFWQQESSNSESGKSTEVVLTGKMLLRTVTSTVTRS